MRTIRLKGTKPGLRKVSMTKLLRSEGDLRLGEAKRRTNRLLEGKKVEVSFASLERARAFATEAERLGAVVEEQPVEQPAKALQK